jgi:hypothetical protein
VKAVADWAEANDEIARVYAEAVKRVEQEEELRVIARPGSYQYFRGIRKEERLSKQEGQTE